MVQAERAFARGARELGIRDAFLKFLDNDAIGLQPTLGRAKDVWRARPAPPDPLATMLEWEPRTGDVAESGDLGWLTGPYTLTPADKTGVRHGCYFSIWRRQSADGPWLVMLDQGISTPEPCAFPRSGFIAFDDLGDRFAGDPAGARETLLAADRQVAASSKIAGPAHALASAAREGVRLLRNDHQPIVGSDAAGAWLAADRRTGAFATADGAVSRAGDMGYTYGSYRFEAGSSAAAETGRYARVWRRGADGAWQLVVDVHAPDH